MKNQPYRTWSLALLLIVLLPLAGGCVQEAASASDSDGAATNDNVAAAQTTNSSAKDIEQSKPDGAPAIDISEAPVKAVATDKPLPANVRTNGPVAEIMKLADSGVDESVLLVYVTNSPSMFSLSADEIIYLNDIGVPSTVVTAMLQHDQALKAAPPQNVWSQPQQTTETAEAQPQTPAPAEVAPQQTAPPPQPAEVVQEVPPAPVVQPTYSSFYQTLAPYGTWVDVDGYGLCWQPTVVVLRPSWRPYFDSGRWVYSDYGWYWASDYSWGWAPFHYGRWFRHHRLGWCWYPDYTWGASWVSWRYSDGYCGWAPLPPCAVYRPGIGLTYWGRHVGVSFGFGLGFDSFAFISWNHFHDHHLHRYHLDDGHARRIYHDTVVSTRIVGNRGHVFNQGLPVEHVSRVTRTEVHKVAVRETSNIDGRGVRGDRLASDGKSLTAYRPKFTEANASRLARTEPVNRNRPGTVRTVAPETAPQGALKPVPLANTRVERTTASDVRRPVPVPATSLASPSTARPNRMSRTEPMLAENNRTTVANPFASASEGRGRSSVVQAPASSSQPSTPVPPTTRSSPNVTRNWQTTPSQPASPARRETTPTARSPWSTSRQSSQPSTQPTVPSRPERSYSAPAQTVPRAQETPRSSAPAAPRYAPAPAYRTAPAQNSTPSYQAPTRPTQTPRYNAPAYSAPPAAPSREYRAPTPSYQAPRQTYQAPTPTYQAPRQTYQAPTPSYQSPSRSYEAPSRSYEAPSRSYEAPARSYTPAPSAPSYSAPSRPSASESRGDSRPSSSDSRGGRNR